MAKFLFKLQNLLKIKEKLEEQSKIEYGKAMAKLEYEKNQMLALKNTKNQNINNIKNNMNNVINVNYIKESNIFITTINKQIKNQLENIKQAEDIVEQKRKKLLVSMKNKKVLETLKEKEIEEYFKEEVKKEQKNIDEIVSYKYNKGEVKN